MIENDLLSAVTVEPSAPADAAVIWLHGMGADGHDFEWLVPRLALPPTARVRFVFPHAPRRPITINRGAVMRAWYDITDLGSLQHEDEDGIRASARALHRMIGQQTGQGIDSRRIVLAGFSQGGAIALHTGLRHPEPLAGVLALSTYLPLPTGLDTGIHPANSGLPILMAHGTDDPVLPAALAERSRDLLQARGLPVEWHLYPMGHCVCPEETAAISAWLRAVLELR